MVFSGLAPKIRSGEGWKLKWYLVVLAAPKPSLEAMEVANCSNGELPLKASYRATHIGYRRCTFRKVGRAQADENA